MRFIRLNNEDREVLSKAAYDLEEYGGLLGYPLPSLVRQIRDRSESAPDALVVITNWLNDHWTGLDAWDAIHIEDIAIDLMRRLDPNDTGA